MANIAEIIKMKQLHMGKIGESWQKRSGV